MKKFTIIVLFIFGTKIMLPAQIINTYKFDNVVNTGWERVYKDGISKVFYIENGISVTTSAKIINKYGNYFQFTIEIENLTGDSFDFNPNDIIGLLTIFKTDKKTKIVSVDKQYKRSTLSYNEYMNKVKSRQNLQSALNSLGAYYNANSAAYSSSVTVTTLSGYSNTYGSVGNYYKGGYSSRGSVSGSAVSVTRSYNGAVAYQARKDAEKEVQALNNELYQIRKQIKQDYLKLHTIDHAERLVGSINFLYEDGDLFELLVPVNGKYYSFTYGKSDGFNEQPAIARNSRKEVVSSNQDVINLYVEAESHFNNKRYSEQLETLTEALKIEPENPKLLKTRALLYFSQFKNYEDGMSDLNKAIYFDPVKESKFSLYMLKASFEFTKSNIDTVLAVSNAAIAIQPQNQNGYFYRALAKASLGDNYGAISDYEKVISISNQNLSKTDNLGVVYNNIGYAYIKVKQFEKAKTYLEKAVDMLPNYSYIWGSLGELHYELKDYKKSTQYTSIAIDLVESGNDKGGKSSDPSIPYYIRALCKINKNDYKNSCSDLYKAVELGNKDAATYLNKYCK